jgi:murein DD-endopeptidase MepM/ murein hydrolase activator NlpD
MITILQRQQVSKRPSPPARSGAHISPFPTRQRTSGVRWSNRDLPAQRPQRPVPQQVVSRPSGSFSALKYQDLRGKGSRKARKKLRAAQRRILALSRDGEGPKHSFLEGQLVRRKRQRAERREKRRGQQEARRPAERPREQAGEAPRLRIVTEVLRTPWLYAGLLVLALAAIAVTQLGSLELGLARQHAVLPVSQDVDPVLYQLLVPDPPPVPASAPNTSLLNTLKVSSYKTAGGDTLSRIASRFRLNVDTLVSWNGIRDARALAAGTLLSVPNADGLRYTVHRGDTLQGIAHSYGVDFNGILDANMLSSSVITVGQDLFIPGARLNPNELNRILGSLFLYPVQGRISSYFGERPDPFTGVPNVHNGIDIVNKPGTAILSAMAGTVRSVGFNFNYGNYVIIQHSGVYQTLYGHLMRYLVTRGQRVNQGQKIGELGTTGYSTGPHLHFSIFKNGEAVDPLRFLK